MLNTAHEWLGVGIFVFFDFTGIEQSETVAFFDAKHFQRIQACGQGSLSSSIMKTVNGKKVVMGKTLVCHIVGKNNNAYTNVKQIKLAKSKFTIKKGKLYHLCLRKEWICKED